MIVRNTSMIIITSSRSLTRLTTAKAKPEVCKLAGNAIRLYPSIPNAATRKTDPTSA
jgi:hypothetical protein